MFIPFTWSPLSARGFRRKMKKKINIWLTEKERIALESKAHELGFSGKGTLSRYLAFISSKNILIVQGEGTFILKAT